MICHFLAFLLVDIVKQLYTFSVYKLNSKLNTSEKYYFSHNKFSFKGEDGMGVQIEHTAIYPKDGLSFRQVCQDRGTPSFWLL